MDWGHHDPSYMDWGLVAAMVADKGEGQGCNLQL